MDKLWFRWHRRLHETYGTILKQRGSERELSFSASGWKCDELMTGKSIKARCTDQTARLSHNLSPFAARPSRHRLALVCSSQSPGLRTSLFLRTFAPRGAA